MADEGSAGGRGASKLEISVLFVLRDFRAVGNEE